VAESLARALRFGSRSQPVARMSEATSGSGGLSTNRAAETRMSL
jgi:hypothetical protein